MSFVIYRQAFKDAMEDYRYWKAYRCWKNLTRELYLRREALAGVTLNNDTVNFIAFLKRRITRLEYRRALAEVRLNKIYASWKNK